MVSASLIKQARRASGLSQLRLARQLGSTQPEVARWESGRVTPSIERLREIVAACGKELTVSLGEPDRSYDADIRRTLALPPARRLAAALQVAEQTRVMRAGDGPPPAPLDVTGTLRALHDAGMQAVLVGEIAEVLHGSPLIPVRGEVTLVPRLGDRQQLTTALTSAGGQPAGEPAALPVDAPERWNLERYGVDVVLMPAPPGTRGFSDLRRDAGEIVVDEIPVTVASLLDLLRSAEASTAPSDRGRVPALRRTLELTPTDQDAARAA